MLPTLRTLAPLALLATAIGSVQADAVYTYTAGPITREVRLVSGRLHTTALRLAGSAPVRTSGPEFRICLGDEGRILTSDDYRAEYRQGAFQCTGPSGAPGVEVRYQPDPDRGVVRKVLRLTNPTDRPLLVRWVEVESFSPGERIAYAVSPSFPALGDWGQPVYTQRFFFGVEFPAARNTALPDGSLQMREYCGVTLPAGGAWQSHPAVAGGAPRGEVSAAFLDYIARISVHWPNVPRPTIYWDGFRVILPPDRTDQGVAMVRLARKMKEQTGFEFYSWTYDAGFDMYRADGLWVPQEPDIWKRTREALKGLSTRLGFWTSFSCIFDTPTHAWGKTQGFGLQHDAAYCLAEPKYAQAMEDRLSQIVRENDMASINFDGMYWGQGFGCNTPGHGHLVGQGAEAGVYGTYAVVVNKMRIFERLRREKPDICLDLFVCGEWASPWWLTVLDGVHTVPGDTLAAGIPSPWLRDDLITVRDIQAWDLHRRQNRQFPLWAEDLYGSQVRANHLIDGIEVTGEAMAARWEDEYVMSLVARGAVNAYIVCSDLGVIDASKTGLRFLGEVANWVKANPLPFRHFALLGGDPARQEPFGYAHGDGRGRAIVGIRNPSIRTQSFPLKITSDYNLGEPGPYQVTMVYPYRYTWPSVEAGETLRIPMADFQVAILEIRAPSRRIEGLPAGRWTEKDGLVQTAGADPEPARPRVSLALRDAASAEIAGQIAIPGGGRAQLQVFVTPPAGTTDIKPTATIDGAPAPVEAHFRNRGASQDAWLLLNVPAGRHSVVVRPNTASPTRLEAWLQVAYTRLFEPTSLAAPAGLLPPLEPAELRRTYPALPATYAVSGLPPMPAGAVRLGDLRSRCVHSETGWGIVGWNRSCWTDDPTLRLGDRTYEEGLGVHAPGRFDFVLDGRNHVFKADIGLHPIPPARRPPGWPKGSARFAVYGDGRLLYRSPVLRETDGPKPISVPLRGVRLLSLAVDDGGDGNFDDLCDWGDARLE